MTVDEDFIVTFSKDYVHWFQLLVHAIPVFIAIMVVAQHYKWQRSIERKTQTHYAEQSNKLIFTTLQLLLFMTIYLSIDSFFTLRLTEHYSRDAKTNTDRIVSRLYESEAKMFINGTDGIYEEVGKEFAKRTNPEQELQVHILAYTLFSVEPKLKTWKENGYLRSVKINLFHLDEEFIRNSTLIDPGWSTLVNTHVGNIKKFIAENKEYLEKNKVEINLHSYSHIPAVHGFKFGEDTYFISFSSWEENGRYIKMPNEDAFVRVTAGNDTKQAEVYRKLFNNWLRHYRSIQPIKKD